MLSLEQRLELLEADLAASPPRISAYEDLPFAILRYDPGEDWTLRRRLRLQSARLRARGKELVTISLAALFWRSVEESEGLEALYALERERGFPAAEQQANAYLSDPDWRPLSGLLEAELAKLDHRKHVAFIVRASVLSPTAYRVSALLDEMQGRSRVATILCYPGTLEGTHGLRFMGLEHVEPLGNYRVKIYG